MRRRRIPALVTLLLVAGCAAQPTVGSGEQEDVLVSRQDVSCGQDSRCVVLTLRNAGRSPVEIPIGASEPTPMPHPLHAGCEQRRADGRWEMVVSEIGTYQAASRHLSIRPGDSGTLRLFDCRPGQAKYRYWLKDARGNLHVTRELVP